MSFFKRIFGKESTSNKAVMPEPMESETYAERFWQQVYDVRVTLYEANFGKLPDDILKLGDLLPGVWPGGGLYVIPAPALGPDATIYTSFGLTNPDMPTALAMTDMRTESEDGRLVRTEGTLKLRENPRPATELAGYGYEIIVAAKENAQWPLWLLQWAVKAEMLKDADLLTLVQKYDGLTIEQVQVGEHEFANLLIAKAQAPLLKGLQLPNGRAELLVATVITDDEMDWSKEHGRIALLAALHDAGIGQFSVLNRESVVSLTGAEEPNDFSDVKTREQMMALAASGRLHKVLLFPAEFGGEDVAMNWLFVPASAVKKMSAVIDKLTGAVNEGAVNKLDVRPEYKGESFVPSRIHMLGSHSEKVGGYSKSIDVW